MRTLAQRFSRRPIIPTLLFGIVPCFLIAGGCVDDIRNASRDVSNAAYTAREASEHAKGAATHARDAALRARSAATEIEASSKEVANRIEEAAGSLLDSTTAAANSVVCAADAVGAVAGEISATGKEVKTIFEPIREFAAASGLAGQDRDQLLTTIESTIKSVGSLADSLSTAADKLTDPTELKKLVDTARVNGDKVIEANTNAILDSTKAIEMNSIRIKESTVEMTQMRKSAEDLEMLGITAGIAAALLYILQYLSNWSWSILKSAQERERGTGDAAFSIACYYLATMLVCLVGSLIFWYRFGSRHDRFQDAPVMLALLSVLACAVGLGRAIWQLICWARQGKPRLCETKKWPLGAILVAAVVIVADLLLAAIEAHSCNWREAADSMLVAAFTMFAAGTLVVVERDDFPLLLSPKTRRPVRRPHVKIWWV